MDPDAEIDPPVLSHPCVALDQAVLHLDGAADGVDHAAELDEEAVAGAVDDAANSPMKPIRCERAVD
jgi:hypothetical protein